MRNGRSKEMREKSEKVIRYKRIEGNEKKESIGKIQKIWSKNGKKERLYKKKKVREKEREKENIEN